VSKTKMSRWTYALPVALAILVAAPAPMTAGATDYDGKYTGAISCDEIPNVTGRLRTGFLLTIADGKARYEREVLRADTSIPQGVTERGSGTVSADGDLALTGSAAGPGWSYQANYRGQVSGKSLRLAGEQQWRLRSGPSHTRPCTITLSRAE
jgi:hypothetical protein